MSEELEQNFDSFLVSTEGQLEVSDRYCAFCKCLHPLTNEYWYRAHKHLGLSKCKKQKLFEAKRSYDPVAKAAYNKKWREENRELVAENKRQWFNKNREQNIEKRKANYRKNIDAHKDAMLRRNYGITLEQYNAMLASQDHGCKICKSKTSNSKAAKSLFVDHCHRTGVVRGILCNKCNAGIAYFNESKELLAEAIRYLFGDCHG